MSSAQGALNYDALVFCSAFLSLHLPERSTAQSKTQAVLVSAELVKARCWFTDLLDMMPAHPKACDIDCLFLLRVLTGKAPERVMFVAERKCDVAVCIMMWWTYLRSSHTPHHSGILKTVETETFGNTAAPVWVWKHCVSEEFSCSLNVWKQVSASLFASWLGLINHNVPLPNSSHPYHMSLFWKTLNNISLEISMSLDYQWFIQQGQ